MVLQDLLSKSNNEVFIIAEAGVNHNGKMELAKQLVDIAADAGADAIKFQTFDPKLLASKNAPKANYQLDLTSKEESQLEMLSKLALSEKQFEELKKYCEESNIIFLSSPFDMNSIDFLISLGVDGIKIPSGEITNTLYLEKIAASDLPVILSTGMATIPEIFEAMSFFNSKNLALLYCVSAYPVPIEEINLKAMQHMMKVFDVPIGFSDHTEGIEFPIASVAMGAKIIEKHFTIDKNLPGPDHKASLAPNELKLMISMIRNLEKGMGIPKKVVQPCEQETRKVARKSLVYSQDLIKGTKIQASHISVKRPGTGIKPKFAKFLMGKTLISDKNEDDLISLDDFE